MSRVGFIPKRPAPFRVKIWSNLIRNYKEVFAIKNKITIEKITKVVEEIAPGTKILSTEYVNEKSPLLFLCSCGTKFTKSWTNIQYRKKCKCNFCSKQEGWKNKRISEEERVNWIKIVNEYGFVPLEEITHIRKKFLFQDSEGYRGYTSLENIKLGKHFSVFSLRFNESNLIYNLNVFFKNKGFDIEALSYIVSLQKTGDIKVECVCECGRHFSTNLGCIIELQKIRCDFCTKRMSNLEKLVDIEIQKYTNNFIFQKRFDDCRNINPLPFDFYLPEYNLCIEVDGDQHEKPVDFLNNMTQAEKIENFEKIKKNDNIKTKYCEDKNIQLIRINFRDFKQKAPKYKEIIANIFIKT